MNTSSTSTSNTIPTIESVTPAPVVTFNPVIENVSELLPCNRSLLKRRHRTLLLRLFVTVTWASRPGGNTNARSFALATGITRDSSVFSTHLKTLTNSGQVFGSLFIVSSPMASACVPAAATGCENMIPRPYGVFQRRGSPRRYTNTGHRNEDLTLAEIRSTTSPVFWPRSVRDFLLLRFGNLALASRIQALMFYKSYPSSHLSFVCTPCVQTPALRCKTSV